MKKTETEIYNELTKSAEVFAVKHKYGNCLFRIKVRETMDRHAQKKLSDAEVVGWVKKLLGEI